MEVGKKLHTNLGKIRKCLCTALHSSQECRDTISRALKKAHGQPTIETLNRLAVALGSSLAEMFNDDTECTYLTEKERHLIENFRRLSDEKADALLEI
ncbi:hypothetical protein [Ruminococcus albus]|uniref:hypothetical protein n=1 Tax=Ruminococcus albus TaxID=1264 RepID=UPI0012BD5D51|nr:hypothetical protein [Ruminococcus albus]